MIFFSFYTVSVSLSFSLASRGAWGLEKWTQGWAVLQDELGSGSSTSCALPGGLDKVVTPGIAGHPW